MTQTLAPTPHTPRAVTTRPAAAVRLGWLAASLLVLAVLVVLSVTLGARDVGLSDVVAGLRGEVAGELDG